MSKDEMPDIEELRGIFEVLKNSVPELLEKITKVIYEAKSGEEYGRAVASFYQALVSAGMSSEQAFALTKEYMSNLSIGNLMKNITGGMASGHDEDDDIGRKIKTKIKRDLEKEFDGD